MKALTLLLCLAATPVYAQIAGGLYSGATVYAGPYQPMHYGGGYIHVNPQGYVPYGGYGYGRGYRTFLQEERNLELRRIRRAIEHDSWQRSWRR